MKKHYIYNCLLKNDAIILWLTSLFSVFHYLYFYNQEGMWSTIIVLASASITSIGLIISMRLRVIIHLYKTTTTLIFMAVMLAFLGAVKDNTNDITSLFLMILGSSVIVVSGLTIKDMLLSTKIGELADDPKKPLTHMRISEIIGLYKLKTYEVRCSRADESDSKYSLFFDYRLNMQINHYDMISLEDDKEYSLSNFAEYCKDNNVDLFHLSKEDFEVYKMMII